MIIIKWNKISIKWLITCIKSFITSPVGVTRVGDTKLVDGPYGDALEKDPDLISLQGDIRHSGEGKWAAQTALEFEIPALVITLHIRYFQDSDLSRFFTHVRKTGKINFEYPICYVQNPAWSERIGIALIFVSEIGYLS